MKLFSESVITQQQASERTGIPIQPIFGWLKKGVLKGYRVAGRYYIPESAIPALVHDACEECRQ